MAKIYHKDYYEIDTEDTVSSEYIQKKKYFMKTKKRI